MDNNRRPQPVRIVIADDHPIFRDGLRRLLEAESDLKVIGEACDGSEAQAHERSGALAKRCAGGCRREILDHVIALNEERLGRLGSQEGGG